MVTEAAERGRNESRGLCATSSCAIDDLNININSPLQIHWPSAKTLFSCFNTANRNANGELSKMPLVPKKRLVPKRAPVSNMLLVPKILLAIMAGGVVAAAVAQLPILLK